VGELKVATPPAEVDADLADKSAYVQAAVRARELRRVAGRGGGAELLGAGAARVRASH